MRVDGAIIAACLLLLTGCPPTGNGAGDGSGSAAPDKYDHYASLVGNLNGAEDELKRLQGQVTTPIQPGGQAKPPQYNIAIESTSDGIALVFAGSVSKDTWRLTVWNNEPSRQQPATVIRDERGPNGHNFEAAINSALTINLNLSWLQDGGVLVRRTFLLGGLENTHNLHENACDWVFSGPWLPYRLIPQPTGPWGVAPGADGKWHSAEYPRDCWLPAAAAFDQRGGWLLGVADEHARKVDRSFEQAWRINPDYLHGDLLRIRTRFYDATRNGYSPGSLASGLELRDALVLQPLVFTRVSLDSASTEAQCTRIIDAMGRFVREYHYSPESPVTPVAGNLVSMQSLMGIDGSEEQTQAFSRFATLADVKYASIGEVGQADKALDDSLLKVLESLGITAVVDARTNTSLNQLVEPRNPKQAAEWMRALVGDGDSLAGDSANSGAGTYDIAPSAEVRIGTYWDLSGVFSAMTDVFQSSRTQNVQRLQATGFPMSPYLAQAVLSLYAAEQYQERAPDAALLIGGYPVLCLPAFADGYVAVGDLFKSRDNSASPARLNPFAARLSNRLAAKVFGANVIAASPDDTLAGLVLAADGRQAGLYFSPGLEEYAGFEVLSRNTARLKQWDHELQFVYSNPISSTYSLEGERPAACDAMIGLVPADLGNAETIWVVFSRIGGSVTVDYRNNLYINWQEDGEESAWTERLPMGFWIIDHPSPDAVSAGDVVVIRKETMSPGTQPGTGAGV